MSWRTQGIYVWRTRRPSGWSRHTAYVGESSARYYRDSQHLYGGRGNPPKPWADLDPKVYPLPCFMPGSKVARKIQEKFWILLLMPVYNMQWNWHNPRRIKPWEAKEQRKRRDEKRWATR